MAQTFYNPEMAKAYASAILNQGHNPIVSWFTDPQGGGLANWIQNQGSQIQNRIKNDLAYKIEHDEALVDAFKKAQNEGRDLRKELLNGYFIDPYDTTLNTAVDNLDTKANNQLATDINNIVTNKLNADEYTGGSILDEAKKLGWEKLTKAQEEKLKKYEQDALKARYEEPLRKQIASNLLFNPTYDPTDLIKQTNTLRGTTFNPADFINPSDEKTTKYNSAVAKDFALGTMSRLQNKNITYDDAEKYLMQLKLADSQNSAQYDAQLTQLRNDRDKETFNKLDSMLLDSTKMRRNGKPLSKLEILQGIYKNATDGGVSTDTFSSWLQKQNLLMDAVNEDTVVQSQKQALEDAKAALSSFNAGFGEMSNIPKALAGTLELTPEFRKALSKHPEAFTRYLSNAGLSDEYIDRFIQYLQATKTPIGVLEEPTKDDNATEIMKKLNTFEKAIGDNHKLTRGVLDAQVQYNNAVAIFKTNMFSQITGGQRQHGN